jgi:uncharacterized protein YjbI with pentapeptide repeats
MIIAECLQALDHHKNWSKGVQNGKRMMMPMANMAGFDLRRASFAGAYLPGATFDHAMLDDSDFSGADLFGASFRKTSLQRSKFVKADLRGASFANADLNHADLTGADLRGGSMMDDFIKAFGEEKAKQKMVQRLRGTGSTNLFDPVGTDFSGAVMVDTIMKNVMVSYANFSNTDLTNAQLSEARIENSNFTDSKLVNTDFKTCKLTNNTATGGMSLHDYIEKGGNLHLNTDVRVIIAAHRLWNETKGASGKRGSLASLDLKNSDFDGMDLSAIDFSGADLSNVSFKKSKLRFCDFSDANLTGADFTGADLRGSAFRFTNMQNVNLTEADLSPAEILNEKGEKTDRVWKTIMMDAQTDGIITTRALLEEIKYVGDMKRLAVLLLAISTGAFMPELLVAGV